MACSDHVGEENSLRAASLAAIVQKSIAKLKDASIIIKYKGEGEGGLPLEFKFETNSIVWIYVFPRFDY